MTDRSDRQGHRARTCGVRIDSERCTGCGLCVRVCPSGILALAGGTVEAADTRCLECGHCRAVCPAGAVSVGTPDQWAESFATFSGGRPSPPGTGVAVTDLVGLMRGRRSCRNFTDRPVPGEMLEDLVRIGVTAPSGTNSQRWTFTLVSTRQDVAVVGERIGDFFRRLNRLAGNPWIRLALKLAGRPALDRYHLEHAASVQRALRAWDHEGRDLLFHGAPALMVVGSLPGGSCPAEDALLATQNILLGAHALGLGTCLIGYAVEAMRHNPDIARFLGMDRDEQAHAVIALGFPALPYPGACGRRSPVIHRFPADPV